jgi:spore maturation protein CgeB
MKMAFYGSSLLSSYWNGAATYYRGLLRALHQKGYSITFYEPDVYGRQNQRDMEPPEWCSVVVYEPTPQALLRVAGLAANADIVAKASGVGYEDEALLLEVMRQARPGALKVFWDVDAPATLEQLRREADHPLHRTLRSIDLVVTYGGGNPVIRSYLALGAARCVPVYNGLDPATHHPVPPTARFKSDLAFLGNRLPDREHRVEAFFLKPAEQMASHSFLIGGAGWDDKSMPRNVTWIGHVGTRDHNAFNASPKAVLNISRDSMASNGFSPATRLFEAAGAGACLISDAWPGIELFLAPEKEVLVARDGQDVMNLLSALSPEKARQIGAAALRRVLADHTYAQRAKFVDETFRSLAQRKSVEAAQ